MFSVSAQVNQKRLSERVRNLSVHALLCFLLVFVQGADLTHSHDGDLQKQFDCDICLKVGTFEDVIASSGESFDFNSDSASNVELAEQAAYVAMVPAKSRAPPLV